MRDLPMTNSETLNRPTFSLSKENPQPRRHLNWSLGVSSSEARQHDTGYWAHKAPPTNSPPASRAQEHPRSCWPASRSARSSSLVTFGSREWREAAAEKTRTSFSRPLRRRRLPKSAHHRQPKTRPSDLFDPWNRTGRKPLPRPIKPIRRPPCQPPRRPFNCDPFWPIHADSARLSTHTGHSRVTFSSQLDTTQPPTPPPQYYQATKLAGPICPKNSALRSLLGPELVYSGVNKQPT